MATESTDELTEQEIFEQAFDADAEGNDPWAEAEPEVEPEAEPEPEAESAPEPEAEPEEDAGEPEAGGEPEAEETPAEAPEAEAPAGEQGKQDLETLLESVKETHPELVNRVKSWEGRLSARDKQIQELQAELDKARKTDSPADTPKGAGQGESDSKEAASDGPTRSETEDADMANFRAEWGDEIADFVEKRSRQIADEQAKSIVSNEIDQRLSPLEQAQQEAQEVHHQQQLDQHHEDWREIAQSDDLTLFIEEQPAYLADTFKRVVQEGSADEVVDLLDRYKAARGMNAQGPEKPQPKVDKREKAAAATAVKSGRTPPKDPGPPSDFEAAFDYYSDYG